MEKSDGIEYSVVVPVFNSSSSLPILNEELNRAMQATGHPYELLYVDDCSTDSSWETLRKLKGSNPRIRIIRLAKNTGHWVASLCGIKCAIGKKIITIDDDLEYDPKDIHLLIEHYEENDHYIVYGIAGEKRKKNLSYRLFYGSRNYLLNKWLGKGVTDSFKLFARKILVDENNKISTTLHFEGYATLMLAQRFVGYVNVSYRKRLIGTSNHSLYKKLQIIGKFSLDYFRSPLKPLIYLGSILLFMSPMFVWATILTRDLSFQMNGIILFVSSIALSIVYLALGLLGYYLASNYLLLRGKPEYLIVEEL